MSSKFEASREDQLTEKNLKYGYWWVTHKVQVRKWFTVALAVIDFVLIMYVGFGYADYYFGSGVAERANLAQLSEEAIDYRYFREKNAPKDLIDEGAFVLGTAPGSFDIVARLSNPNPLWWAEFDFHFVTPTGSTPDQRGYILPNSTRSLAALGMKQDATPSSASLSIDNLTWKRVDQHDTLPDYATWAAQRQRLTIGPTALIVPSPGDTIPAYRARFSVTNDTGFGFYKVGFFITLLSGGNTVGVNKVTISELRPGEERDVEATWFSDVGATASIEVVPEINIFDPVIYIPPGR